MPRGSVTVVAGATGVGRTAFALQVLAHGLTADGGRVQVVESGEMRHQEVAALLVAQLAGLSRGEATGSRESTPETRERMKAAAGPLRDAPLVICDDATMSVDALFAHAQQVRAERGAIDLIVVDTWHHIEQREMERAPSALEAIAREFECAVLVTAVLPTRVRYLRPGLDDIHTRDEGLFSAAKTVLMLARQNAWSSESDDSFDHSKPEAAEIVVAKSVDSPVGVVPVTWRGRECRYD